MISHLLLHRSELFRVKYLILYVVLLKLLFESVDCQTYALVNGFLDSFIVISLTKNLFRFSNNLLIFGFLSLKMFSIGVSRIHKLIKVKSSNRISASASLTRLRLTAELAFFSYVIHS